MFMWQRRVKRKCFAVCSPNISQHMLPLCDLSHQQEVEHTPPAWRLRLCYSTKKAVDVAKHAKKMPPKSKLSCISHAKTEIFHVFVVEDDVISIARTFCALNRIMQNCGYHNMQWMNCACLYHEAYAPVSTVIAIFISLGLAYYGKINIVFMFVLCVFFPEASWWKKGAKWRLPCVWCPQSWQGLPSLIFHHWIVWDSPWNGLQLNLI